MDSYVISLRYHRTWTSSHRIPIEKFLPQASIELIHLGINVRLDFEILDLAEVKEYFYEIFKRFQYLTQCYMFHSNKM